MKQTATFPGRYAEIRNIGRFLAAGCDAAVLDDDAHFQIELAADEACTNIIEHAYGGEDIGDIDVTWEVTEQALVITLRDDGPPFAPDIAQIRPSTASADNELQVGGLGLHFIRNLVDEIHYNYTDGTGNELTLIKWRPVPPGAPIKWLRRGNGIYLVSVQGRLDHLLNAEFETTLNQLLDNHHTRLIIDMKAVTYINSSGLRILVSAWRKTRRQNGNVVLVNLTGQIMSIFTMVGFDKLFDIHDSVDAAQDALETIE
jgi:anti-anti-sigma factor